MLLLPEDPNAVVICVATGTGIAPFRTFWRRMFMENVPSYKFSGGCCMFGGRGPALGWPARSRVEVLGCRRASCNTRG